MNLADGGFRIWVADAADGVVGYAFTQPTQDDDLDRSVVGELTALYVLPELFGRRVGLALNDKAIDGMRMQGFLQATLWVIEGNERAMRFYRRTGWEPDGKRDSCYRVFNAPALRFRYPL